MPVRLGKCTKFAECNTADSESIVDVTEGAPFLCPECGSELTPFEPPTRRKWLMVAGSGAALAASGAVLYKLMQGKRPPQPTPRQRDVVFLISLSPTIANVFLPDTGRFLQEAFAKEPGHDGMAFSLWGFCGPGVDNFSPFEVRAMMPQPDRFAAFDAALPLLKPNPKGGWKHDAIRALDAVLDKSGWQQGADHDVVIITDSSSSSNQGNERSTREKADRQKVCVSVVHVLNHLIPEDHLNGERQYRLLSDNARAGGKEGYYPVKGSPGGGTDGSYRANFRAALYALVESLSRTP